MRLRRLLVCLLFVALFMLYVSSSLAQSASAKPQTITSGTSIELALVLSLISLAFAIGKAWNDLARHSRDTNIHHTPAELAQYMQIAEHARICTAARTEAALEKLTRAIVAAIPEINNHL